MSLKGTLIFYGAAALLTTGALTFGVHEWDNHVRARLVSHYEQQTAKEHDRRVTEVGKAEERASHAEQVANQKDQTIAQLLSRNAKASHANDNHACLDPDSVRRLGRIGQQAGH